MRRQNPHSWKKNLSRLNVQGRATRFFLFPAFVKLEKLYLTKLSNIHECISHVGISCVEESKASPGSLSLVFGDKIREEGAHQTKHNSNVVKEANLAEDTFEMGKFWF